MSRDQDQIDYDDADDFEDAESNALYDLDFNDTKAMKKQHRAKARSNARRRVEDYFERKAMKEKYKEWDYDLDYDY